MSGNTKLEHFVKLFTFVSEITFGEGNTKSMIFRTKKKKKCWTKFRIPPPPPPPRETKSKGDASYSETSVIFLIFKNFQIL